MAISYIKYLKRAKTRYRIHSPFVYRLTEEVLRGKTFFRKADIRKLRKRMAADNRKIEITDLGAGSRVTKSASRTVSEILRVSTSSMRDAGILQRLAVFTGAKNILELGTNLGIGTATLAAAPGAEKVYSIEGDPNLAAIAVKNLEFMDLNANVVVGSFEENLDLTLEKLQGVDLAYLDGNHQKQPTLSYIDKIIPAAHNNSVIVIGDIHWSAEMEEAWEEIKAKPEVQTTVELFNMGLVFFKSELSNEHFTIKL